MTGASKEQFMAQRALHQKMPLFFQPWWLDAVARNWDVVALTNPESGAFQAIWPFQIEKKAGLTLFRNPGLTPYLGPWLATATTEKQSLSTDQILEQLFNKIPNFADFKLSTLPNLNYFAEMHQLGFSNSVRRTYYLALDQPEETLWAQIHPRRRNYIRRAGEQLTVVEEAQPDLATFHRWHRQAFQKRQQGYPYTLPFLERVIRTAREHDSARFLTAYDQQQTPVAMLWTPFDAEKAYHLLGAFNPKQPVNGAMDLLVWEAIRSARTTGRQLYDFEGSMDPGIASFFRKFGGTPVWYFEFHQSRSVIWRLKQLLF